MKSPHSPSLPPGSRWWWLSTSFGLGGPETQGEAHARCGRVLYKLYRSPDAAFRSGQPASQVGRALEVEQSYSFYSRACGLISLHWVSFREKRSLSAGFYWALAMIKPQIALPFAIPMLRRNRLFSLTLGAGALLALSAFALAHTSTKPMAMLSSWLRIVSRLDGKGTSNVLSGLLSVAAGIPLPILLLLFIAASGAALFLANRLARRAERFLDNHLWDLAGLCATLGYIFFYRRHYDSIMLFPAMLACFRACYKSPNFFNIFLCTLIAALVWLPERLWMLVPHSETIALVIPALIGTTLMLRIINSKIPPCPAVTGA